uniref:Uncharacterized protein n=1 Tax=Romanomermis culicivorax TaxID=13658 RepID=A0A915K9U8_ROMCU
MKSTGSNEKKLTKSKKNLKHQVYGFENVVDYLKHQIDGEEKLTQSVKNLKHQVYGFKNVVENLKHQNDG